MLRAIGSSDNVTKSKAPTYTLDVALILIWHAVWKLFLQNVSMGGGVAASEAMLK